MKKVLALTFALASLSCAAGCKRSAGPNLGAAKEMLGDFVKSGADPLALTLKLRPQPADYDAVFPGDGAQKVKGMLDPVWDGLKAGIKPGADQTEVQVYAATAEELKNGAPQCPSGYKDVADKLDAKVVMYCFRFVKPGSQSGLDGDGLFFLNDHWAMFPRAFKAFKQ